MRTSIHAKFVVPLVLAAGLSGASAQQAAPSLNDQGICPGIVVFGEDIPVRLMRVVAKEPRTHFIEGRGANNKAGCPNETPECLRKGFVVPGDDVLGGWGKGNLVCVSYVSPNAKRVKGQFPETHGYLPASALQDVPLAAPKTADWLGTWSRSAEAEITITAGAGGKLTIKGEALFGSLDPGRVKRGAVNSGELDFEVAPIGNGMAMGENYTDPAKLLPDDPGECRARFRLFGRYLVVQDSGGCGGMNVSFSGIYVRLKP